MRSHGGGLAVIACLFGCVTTVAAQNSHVDILNTDVQKGYLDRALVVQLDDGYIFQDTLLLQSATVQGEGPVQVQSVIQAINHAGVTSIRPVVPFEIGDKALADDLGLTRTYLVNLDGSMGSIEASDLLERAGDAVIKADPVVVGVQMDWHGPNDPGFPTQYSLHNLGQTIAGVEGVSDSDVDAVEAWSLTSGAGQWSSRCSTRVSVTSTPIWSTSSSMGTTPRDRAV